MKNLGFSLCFLAMLLSGVLRAQDVASTWQGSFQSDSGQHRAVLQIRNGDKGGQKGGGFFVEYFPDWLDVTSLVLDGSSLKIRINGGKGSYDGKMSADGSSIEGTWTYDRHSATLQLQRTATEAAWRVPFPSLHQYHYQGIHILRPSPDEATIPFSPQLALAYMEQGATAWTGSYACVACHTNGTYMVARPMMMQKLGPPQKELRDFFVTSLHAELAGESGPKWEPDVSQIVYIAAGLAIWDAHVTHRLSPETAQALGLMFRLQQEAGDWYIDDPNNPPLESSPYQLATVAARAVGNAPGWLAQQQGTPLEAKVNLLVRYLRAEKKLQADYDRTDLLWAASEFAGLLDAAKVRDLIAMVSRHQMPDGGWSIRTFATPEEWGHGNRAEKLRAEPELNDPHSDGHMTGLAIVALRSSGVPASDPRIRRGVSWLLANQRSSGRWWTRSLLGDNWQFMSYSGTVYPLLALSMCDALPAQLSATVVSKADLSASSR